MIHIDTLNIHLTEADSASYDSLSQVLKAATAYVSPQVGRMLAVAAKAIELSHMMDYLDSGDVSACSTGGRQMPPEEILRDLRKYCGPKEQEQLDKFLNIMNMAKMYELYRNLSGAGDMMSAAQAMAKASGANVPMPGTNAASNAPFGGNMPAAANAMASFFEAANNNYGNMPAAGPMAGSPGGPAPYPVNPAGPLPANDYLQRMQSMLTPEQMQLIQNISRQQSTFDENNYND